MAAELLKIEVSYTTASGISLDIYDTETALRNACGCGSEANSSYFRTRLAYLLGRRRKRGRGEVTTLFLMRDDVEYLLRDIRSTIAEARSGAAEDLLPYVPAMQRTARNLETILKSP